MNAERKTVLWWGRFNKEYSRNRILQKILKEQHWEIVEFRPSFSSFADLLALFKKVPPVDFVWVPSFRQRDFYAARRFARLKKIPILFDPLISSYDKRVFENGNLGEGGTRAERLRKWESGMFRTSDVVLADTDEHARFFEEELGANSKRVFTVPVGAEEALFGAQPVRASNHPLEVLFYGSFVPLQGVQFIVEAARLVPEVNWTLLGRGKLREGCERAAEGVKNIRFEDWVPYNQLAKRIGRADVLLGIFGGTPKAARVIPNKFYQAMACARPIVTMDSPVYSKDVREQAGGGVVWVPPASPDMLAQAVREWVARPDLLAKRCADARALYEKFYANDTVSEALRNALKSIRNC